MNEGSAYLWLTICKLVPLLHPFKRDRNNMEHRHFVISSPLLSSTKLQISQHFTDILYDCFKYSFNFNASLLSISRDTEMRYYKWCIKFSDDSFQKETQGAIMNFDYSFSLIHETHLLRMTCHLNSTPKKTKSPTNVTLATAIHQWRIKHITEYTNIRTRH